LPASCLLRLLDKGISGRSDLCDLGFNFLAVFGRIGDSCADTLCISRFKGIQTPGDNPGVFLLTKK